MCGNLNHISEIYPLKRADLWNKKGSHFDLKSWLTGGTKILPGIPSSWWIYESNWLDFLTKNRHMLQTKRGDTSALKILSDVENLWYISWNDKCKNQGYNENHICNISNFSKIHHQAERKKSLIKQIWKNSYLLSVYPRYRKKKNFSKRKLN